MYVAHESLAVKALVNVALVNSLRFIGVAHFVPICGIESRSPYIK